MIDGYEPSEQRWDYLHDHHDIMPCCHSLSPVWFCAPSGGRFSTPLQKRSHVFLADVCGRTQQGIRTLPTWLSSIGKITKNVSNMMTVLVYDVVLSYFSFFSFKLHPSIYIKCCSKFKLKRGRPTVRPHIAINWNTNNLRLVQSLFSYHQWEFGWSIRCMMIWDFILYSKVSSHIKL